MRRTFTGGLALLLTLALLLAACGGPKTRPGQSRPPRGESASAQAVPDSESESPESPSPASDSESGAPESSPAPETEETPEEEPGVTEDGWYNTRDEVAEYLHLYNRLPGNYKTKKEAQAAGWSGGSVEPYTGEGTAIGGDRFGNREGLLPKAKGRQYTECDIDTVGKKSRGAKRIIFSNDGLIYYTEDHYNTFELLYGEG